MKTQSIVSFELLTKADLIKLTRQVKETVATHVYPNSSKTFTTADLWNIQRHRKTAPKKRGLVFS